MGPSGRRGWAARLADRAFHRALDRIDAGLEQGAIEAWSPDGTTRILGGRASGPVCEVRLHRWRALTRLARSGSAGWYEAWAAGDWSSPDPVPLFDLFMRNRASLGKTARARGLSRLFRRLRHTLRRNDRAGARRNILAHYDLGNDFYAAWLDPTMSYSSALFRDPYDDSEPLEAAQRRKVDAVVARMALPQHGEVLEIGCGWGHFGRVCAEAGHRFTGITLSPSQRFWAEREAGGLDPRPDYVLRDYRDVAGQYDGIASIEMAEAVGQRYWGDYLDAIARCLKPGGRAAIQYIAIADDVFEDYGASADFIQTYIFPGGMLLSESRFRALAEARGLEWRDRAGFGLHYAETLKRWRARFDAAVDAGRLPQGFDKRFADLWRYYLMYCEGGFRGGGIDVAQVTLVKR